MILEDTSSAIGHPLPLLPLKSGFRVKEQKERKFSEFFSEGSVREYNEYKRRRCMLVHLHFHKAGGTSLLSYFNELGLKHGGPPLEAGRGMTENFLDHAGDIDFWMWLESRGIDIVSLEANFLTPKQMNNISSRRCMHFLTVVRDPWTRFRSTYERELFMACYTEQGEAREGCIAKNSLKAWMEEGNIKHQFPRSGVWGGTLSPNYYVRMLNGINAQTDHEELTDFHLEQAKATMRRFDVVSLLENKTETKSKFDAYFNASKDLPSLSNNFLKSWMSYEAIITNANKQKALFEEQNILDRKFYNWVKEELLVT